jgi:hypothetical protein
MKPEKKNTLMDIINTIYKKYSNIETKDILYKYIIQDKTVHQILIKGDTCEIQKLIISKINNYFTNIITDYIYKKDIEHDLESIFISNTNMNNEIIETENKYETSIQTTTSNENILTTTIYTNLEEIYSDKIKEITIVRQRIQDKKINLEEIKMYVKLMDDKIIFENEGDDYIDSDNNIKRGHVVVKIKCKKHKRISRVNEFDLLLTLPITMRELFKGFSYKFKYFNNEELDITSARPLEEYKFDGTKLIIRIPEKGLRIEQDRGELIIHLILYKNRKFEENLKLFELNCV